MKYRLKYINLDNGYVSIHIYPTIEKCIEAIEQLMLNPRHKYKITIKSKYNQ